MVEMVGVLAHRLNAINEEEDGEMQCVRSNTRQGEHIIPSV